jgi:hypothetical protein
MKHIIKGTEKENSFSYDSSSIIRRLFLGIVFNIGPSYQRMKTLSCRDAGCDCDYVVKG